MITRAIRKAYFSDIEGNNIIDFQFSPHELEFSETARMKMDYLTGVYGVNIAWNSASYGPFSVKLFIDRTKESFASDKLPDTKKTIKTPSWFPRPDQSSAIVQAVKNIVNPIKNRKAGSPELSTYDPAPSYKQDEAKYNGVLTDLVKFQYFIRPEGYSSSIPGMLVNSNDYKGKLNVEDESELRFSPPPIIRFFNGDIWMEGYVSKFNYKLGIMDMNLIPQRLTGEITINVHRGGQFQSIGNDASLGISSQENFLTA